MKITESENFSLYTLNFYSSRASQKEKVYVRSGRSILTLGNFDSIIFDLGNFPHLIK